MDNLLLEIGSEEIPAGYIEPALTALASGLLKKMSEARIEHGRAVVYGTPRRLAVEVTDVASRQKSLTTEIIGPPERVGFDEQGKPRVAAEKFAEKVGIPVNRLTIKKTEKGTYLCGKKMEPGLATRTILKDILPELILATPFPKTMRWADLSIAFARPIHSILALLGDKIVSFNLGRIKSGRYTYGHSFMSPGRIRIAASGDYKEQLRSAHVLIDVQERKKWVEREITKAAVSVGGCILPDEELLDIVTNLVEYPVPVVGKYEEKFLELPKEILITAMREHQKYFAVIDANGKLMPSFIAVNNTLTKDMNLVANGHERVIRARLEDARFFYKADLEVSLEDQVEKLKGVLFQAKLGTMHQKVLRVQKLVGFLVDVLGYHSDLKNRVLRAALLCKADLVSQVVVEFPKLQGVMGRVYAAVAGEDDETAAGIEEHYRPTYSGGPLPETLTGAILSIADKIDSICGCFCAGLIPTGASDPYALRRQGIGVVQIILHNDFSFSLRELIEESITLFDIKSGQEVKAMINRVYNFLQSRMAHLLTEDGFSKDVIAAVVDVSADHVPNVWRRVHALEDLKSAPDFDPLAIAFKRVVNILKQAGVFESAGALAPVEENLFQHECESTLYLTYKKVKRNVSENLGKGFFDRALLDVASLRNDVDAFFDGVMVLTEDMGIRKNRLTMLGHIAALFGKFADFSKIST
ncbi:MAG: glycine--tRNA ligase subunit beta [Deltaproteobacteria bacterium]|nr:glycine--tRNA ligase subunit beta [Deltaproteobacteria bacterium]